ncbi:unnamed protein product [Effrenium voratum]|uniref:Kinesin-like protein n=1 Tax=Effrenium voratum TaxID=2562239 RepID=A0AA36N701_9DINO|nr:unnamed protein product [Effrenium voratum]
MLVNGHQIHSASTSSAGRVNFESSGYNCCLFAYGQTGTGKTHTVHGDWQSQEHRGLLPRLAEGLFERLGKLEGSSSRVRISYIEVYNDRLRDLLSPRSEFDGSPRKAVPSGPGRLEIRTHPAVGVYVENLQELAVDSFRDVARLVAKGEKSKKVERTTMNHRSSRSHTIFTFKVEVRKSSPEKNSMATIQIVDLAGRENEQTSECKGERFQELRFINRSLFELANCIHALCDGNREHVPFRNSKLTMLLSDSLTNNSRTTLLATLTPSPGGFDENILTCRFLESTGAVPELTWMIPLQERLASCIADIHEPTDLQFKLCTTVFRMLRTYDGTEPLALWLDDESFVSYCPDVCDAGIFHQLSETLALVASSAPRPPKDTSAANDRSQFYAAGTFEDAALEAAQRFRLNPRWCLAGRALQGQHVESVLVLRDLVEKETRRTLAAIPQLSAHLAEMPLFNSVLVNHYMDGQAQIKWHADDENCYGCPDQILIGSLSLGAPRRFELRRKPRKGDADRSAQARQSILLQPGSLLIMAGATQARWQHCLPPDDTTDPRINLTFRRICGDLRRGELPEKEQKKQRAKRRSRITTQPVVNRFAAAEVAKTLQAEIADLQSGLAEGEALSSAVTLLRQFSLVWAEDNTAQDCK